MPSWQLNQSQLDYRGSASVLGPAAGRLTAASGWLGGLLGLGSKCFLQRAVWAPLNVWMLRLVSPIEEQCTGGVCRRQGCAHAANGLLGFCMACEAARTSERQRLELLVGEIDRRFPGLLAVLTAEHVAALPAHLVAHYRPGVDWRFVLPALHDAWTETLERLAERAADVAERR